MSIPNVLSLFRIVLIPVFAVIFFAAPEYSWVAAVILTVSGLTDFLDGFIARKFNQITQLGKILDPLADKLTQLTACICLAIRHKEFIIILCLLVAKEFIMLIAGCVLLRSGYKLPSSRWFGKVSTVVFYLVMVYAIWNPTLPTAQLGILVLVMLAFAVLAFALYIPEFFKLRKKEAPGQVTCAEFWQNTVRGAGRRTRPGADSDREIEG